MERYVAHHEVLAGQIIRIQNKTIIGIPQAEDVFRGRTQSVWGLLTLSTGEVVEVSYEFMIGFSPHLGGYYWKDSDGIEGYTKAVVFEHVYRKIEPPKEGAAT